MSVLSETEPRQVLRYFEEMCAIPHGSGNTKKISDYLVSFANKHHFEYHQDKLNNVVIYKDASAGMENHDGVILQAHMDMVCVKEPWCEKDMSTEGLDLYVEDGFIRARGTSLGADDSIGIAMILAILDNNTLIHPPICAVFTVDEETGMYGAASLDKSLVRGNKMINLDSEDEHSVVCGCAGGTHFNVKYQIFRESLNDNDVFYRLTVNGLSGGHSGNSIHLHKANAIRLLARALYGLSLKYNVRMCSFDAGVVVNAIPADSEAIVAVPESCSDDFERLFAKHKLLFSREYQDSEKEILLGCEKLSSDSMPNMCVTFAQSKSILRSLASLPDGLIKTSDFVPYVPVLSSNIGIAHLIGNEFTFNGLIRSNNKDDIEELTDKMKSMAKHDGGVYSEYDNYPGWRYKENSALRDVYISSFGNVSGENLQPEIIHAGLEVGYLIAERDDIDVISIGPDTPDIHTTSEAVNIQSILRVYSAVIETLAHL